MKNLMKKKAKILLIVSIIVLVQINGAIVCMAYKDNDDYDSSIESIYDKMATFTFVFDTQPLTYSVHFGGMFEKYNDTHKRFTADVFVITENQYYVSALSASLTFDIIFSATGLYINHSGSDGDTSSIFFPSNEVIYEFEVYEFFVHKDLFPVTLTIDFDYTLHSSEFHEVGSYSVTKTFEWDLLFIIIIIVIVIAVAVGVSIVLIIVLLRRRKKRRAPIDSPYKPVSPYEPSSPP
jgi:flagellar basal body-associated protein FliL